MHVGPSKITKNPQVGLVVKFVGSVVVGSFDVCYVGVGSVFIESAVVDFVVVGSVNASVVWIILQSSWKYGNCCLSVLGGKEEKERKPLSVSDAVKYFLNFDWVGPPPSLLSAKASRSAWLFQRNIPQCSFDKIKLKVLNCKSWICDGMGHTAGMVDGDGPCLCTPLTDQFLNTRSANLSYIAFSVENSAGPIYCNKVWNSAPDYVSFSFGRQFQLKQIIGDRLHEPVLLPCYGGVRKHWSEVGWPIGQWAWSEFLICCGVWVALFNGQWEMCCAQLLRFIEYACGEPSSCLTMRSLFRADSWETCSWLAQSTRIQLCAPPLRRVA